MNARDFNVNALLSMRHSAIENYVIPGLTSYLIGNPSPHGTVRMLECDREHQETITPHSHRFGFQCWVLRGRVRNRLWTRSINGDWYHASRLVYSGEVGAYVREEIEEPRALWRFDDEVFEEGECYAMTADQIHSIYFSRGTRVLFFEGPTTRDNSAILEPWSCGEVIPTLRTEPWMFRREVKA